MFERRHQFVGPREVLRTGEVGKEDARATSKARQQKEIMEMHKAMTKSSKTQTAMGNVVIEKLDRDALIII